MFDEKWGNSELASWNKYIGCFRKQQSRKPQILWKMNLKNLAVSDEQTFQYYQLTAEQGYQGSICENFMYNVLTILSRILF